MIKMTDDGDSASYYSFRQATLAYFLILSVWNSEAKVAFVDNYDYRAVTGDWRLHNVTVTYQSFYGQQYTLWPFSYTTKHKIGHFL